MFFHEDPKVSAAVICYDVYIRGLPLERQIKIFSYYYLNSYCFCDFTCIFIVSAILRQSQIKQKPQIYLWIFKYQHNFIVTNENSRFDLKREIRKTYEINESCDVGSGRIFVTMSHFSNWDRVVQGREPVAMVTGSILFFTLIIALWVSAITRKRETVTYHDNKIRFEGNCLDFHVITKQLYISFS